MFYSVSQLSELMLDLESHQVERKRSTADSGAIHRNICAFANDLPAHGKPGAIFVGLEDDGSCAHTEINDELLRSLANMRGDGSIQPIPTVSVARHTLHGCDVAVMQVVPSADPPVRYQGRVWVKIGPTVQQASPDDERRLADKRRARDLTFDRQLAVDASVDDLDLDYIRSVYLPAAISPEVLAENQRPLESQLRALHLVDSGSPTYGALIAMGQDPQRWFPGAYVQFLRIAGTEVTDPILDQKALTGRLEDVLRRLDDLIAINISVVTDISSRSREVRYPDYPAQAVRQLVHNAVMHRLYVGTNAPSRCYWYDDRIEIMSPGGLHGSLTESDVEAGVTAYRNPLIAEVMHHLGYAQRFGFGIQIAKTTCARNGNPLPEFDFGTNQVTATLRARRIDGSS